MRYALCLFASVLGFAGDANPNEFEAVRVERVAQYRAVLSKIAADPTTSEELSAHDLPDDLREAVEAWTR